MKAMLFLLPMALITTAISAQHTDRDIVISASSASLQQVLTLLREDYALRFSYNNEQVPLGKKLTLSPGTIKLSLLLKSICEQTGLEHHIAGDQIVLRAKPRPTATQLVQGCITDAATGQPIPYVSIALQDMPNGTLSNEAGLFALTLRAQHMPATLVFSCIGYKSQKIALSSPVAENLTIHLEPETVHLAAVEVHAKTGLSILEEALARMRENYDTGAVRYTLFVRDLTLANGEPIGASEAVHEAYRGTTHQASARQTSLVKGRRDKDHATYQRILSTFPRWTGFDLWVDLDLIFKSDLALPRDDDSFLSKKFLQQHDFELLGTSRLNNRDVYVIAFDQKDRFKNRSLYTGKLYVDLETLAFVRIASGLSPKGIRQARFFGTTRAMALIFGYPECRIGNITTITDYTPINDKWHIRAIHVDLTFTVAKTRKALDLDLNLKGDLIVTDMELANPKPLETEPTMTADDFRYRLYSYDSTFWNSYTTIATDRQTEEAFATIAAKNKRSPFDPAFWKRYQPYKSNPSLLKPADSAQATQALADTTSSAPAKTPAAKPHYATLTQTHHTKHFILAHTPADSLSATTLGHLLEDNYARVLGDFNMTALPEPVLAEIYPSIDDYHFAIGKPAAPPSDAGMATSNTTFKMVSPRNPGPYHTTTSLMRGAIHEFAHCVHYCFVATLNDKDQHELALHAESPWLFEALACYEAGQFYEPTRFAYLADGHYPTLRELNEVDANGNIYDVGFVLIDYIIKTFGKEALLKLVRSNSNTVQAFGQTEAGFERGFYQYLKQKYFIK